MHAELSALKSREIADISQSIASLPHMTFGKRPLKLKPKASKPPSSVSNNTNNATTTQSAAGGLSIPKASKTIADKTLASTHQNLSKQKAAARRSSFGQRGKRAKGSFEQGESVMPHESVPSHLLYRHIDVDLPEPHRARHLLVWCARRAAAPAPADNAKGKSKAKKGLSDADSALVVSVQDRIVRQLMDLTIDIPLYDVSGSHASKLKGAKEDSLAEDPVNVRNREHKERLAKAEERARDEDAMWSKVIQDYNSLQSTVLSTLPDTSLSEPANPKSRRASQHGPKSQQQIFDVRLTELDDKWRKVDAELEAYRMESEKGSELDASLAKRCKQLPLKLDALRQSLARSTAFTEQAKEFIDNLFVSINPQSQPSPLPPLSSTASGEGNKPLSNLFSKLAIAGPTTAAAAASNANGDAADLFRVFSQNDTGEVGRYDTVMDERRVTTAVQPATPRRMPGTPRRGPAVGNETPLRGGGAIGGSALKRG
ncbi:hypothetical protein M408DRAFT_252201 [Serendipita vermifera MAFF 305830]|uniref:Uncharacterized protein n=1 Tax=Serendipita vermifera MAFF 305830 TaxID=933852 RepID=A0A0C3AUC8_SERVB|nr:hypothetical protein M408DRAFT_252201 [Serendipita vermifera MAFF 305830]